jgi:hypothetical protein
MWCAPTVRWGFSPLDEELGLLPGHLTPNLQRHTTLLGSWIPFEQLDGILGDLLGVAVSAATLRRCTEHHGGVYEAVQTAAVTQMEQELPAAAQGPPKLLLSVDGAMVPLVGGAWAEVKTLVLGEVGAVVSEDGEAVVHSTALSYFSRLTDAERFQRLALVETQRRGVETAQQVLAPTDGAVWIQGFLDYHRHDAQRILDFGHAAEYVAVIGSALGTTDSAAFQTWFHQSLHTLKHDGATALMPELREQVARHPEQAELSDALAYLEKRTPLMDYPEYQRQGWPIGSGSVESANKLVVEARLKRAGMHWAPAHVNPLLSLRNAICSDRWDEAWQNITSYQQQQRRQRFLSRAQQRTVDWLPPALPLAPAATEPVVETEAPVAVPKERGRPAADHPWRRSMDFTPSRRSLFAKN